MFIHAVQESEADGPVAEYYRQQREAWGFLPNYAAAFSPRPEVAQAWNVLGSTIREGMDRRRFELATIAAARALKSTYCTTAHAKFLRDVCHDEESLHLIARSPDGAELQPQERAVFRFATKVAVDATSVEQADVDDLRAEGLSDQEIADVVYAVAARAFFTRVLDGLGAQLDPETAAAFDEPLLRTMIVGRAVAAGKSAG